MKKLAFILLVFTVSCSQNTSNFSADITTQDIKSHISFLASDSLKGRDTGSADESVAAAYIIDRFKEANLKPLGENGLFIQEFDVIRGYKEGENGSSIQFGERTFSSLSDSILAYGGSASASVSADLVVIGYGINAPKLNYIERVSQLKNTIVLLMRFGPDGESNPHSAFGEFGELDKKIAALVDLGVKGILVTDGPLYEKTARTLSYRQGKARVSVPIIQISSEIAAQLIPGSFIDYQTKINSKKKPNLIFTKKPISISVDIQENTVIAKNVIGILKGTDKDAGAIVIGAHYDHLGMGGSNSLSATKVPTIHNGADDNASGTAGVLELAHYYSKHKTKHDMIFMAFSGEELGLLGSDNYVNNPTYPLDSMRAMINMDMIGRLNNRSLLIFGTGSASAWDTLITSSNLDSLDIKMIPDGTGASDHTSFYNKNISVLHYFTDTHSDYHRPSDDTEYINFLGEKLVLEHITRVVAKLDTISAKTFYFTEAPVTQKRSVAMSGVTLGVTPDYGFRGEGMRITGATEGRAGAEAGLIAGDIIIQIGKKKLKDIYDYMDALNEHKKGDKSTIIVKRGEDDVSLTVHFK